MTTDSLLGIVKKYSLKPGLVASTWLFCGTAY